MNNNKENENEKQTARKSTGSIRTSEGTSLSPNNHGLKVRVIARNPFEKRSQQLRNSIDRVQYGVGRGKSGRIRMLEDTIKSQRRKRQSTIRLNRLRKLQERHEYGNSIPFAAFNRAVREVAGNVQRQMQIEHQIRFQLAAIQALRDASEGFITNMFETCSLFVAHGNRVTLMPKDIELAKRIWNGNVKTH